MTQRRDIAALVRSLPAARLRVALLGRGIAESLTPPMHEAEARRLDLDYAYGLLDFDALGLGAAALPEVVRAARQGLAGLNVTHPFKQDIIPLLDGLAPDAAAIGAVNTVVFRDGRATGHNTDWWGFAESFRRFMGAAPPGRVLLVGAGGAGMAVARALLDLGAVHVAVFDLDAARAARLAASLARQFGAERASLAAAPGPALAAADGLVNATPVGMAKYPGLPVPVAALHPGLWVAELIYFPAETALLRAAAAAGCRLLPGRGMAVFQAVKAFELFTGVAPDADAMARHFETAGRGRAAAALT